MKLSNIYLHAEKVNGFDIGSEDKITLMKSGKPCFVLNNSSQKVNTLLPYLMMTTIKKGSDDEVTPLSPFSSHKLVLSMLNAATGRASYWMVDDKLEDKFDGAVSQSMFNGRGNTHHSSQVSAGKRSASTVFEDDGPSQKRSRTSGQIADSDTESTASTLSQETGSSRKLKVKGIRSIPMEPTVPEEEETGEGGVSMDNKI